MGLENNLVLRMQRLQLASTSADIQRVSARYDTRLQLQGSVEDSEIPPGYIPTPGGTERGLLTARLLRDFSSGTTLGVELDTQRNYFESLSPTADPQWRTTAGLSLRQSLWRDAFGEGGRAQINYVQQRLASLEQEYVRAQEEVAARIMETYGRAFTARQVADTQETMMGRLGRLLEVNRQRVEEGLLDRSAVLAVEAALAVAEVDVEVLRYEAQGLDEQLKERIDLPAREWDTRTIDYDWMDLDAMTPSPGFVEVFENALHYRADVEALRREEKRVEDLIRWRQAEDRPELEARGFIGRGDSDTSWDETLDFNQKVWSVGIFLDMSLQRSDTRALVTQAILERDRIRTERDMLERSIELACRSAIRQWNTSRRLVTATARALELQKQKLDFEVQRYQRGQSDTKTLLDYENDRDQAARDQIKARGAFELSEVGLRLVQGLLFTGETP